VNYIKHKGSALFTAHQLNRGAAQLATSGQTNVVKKFNMSFLSDSMDVQRECDCIIYMFLEKNHLGVPYLTMKMDKHRHVDDTPEAHKACAYRFTPIGIMDDMFTSDQSIKDIYLDNYQPGEEPVIDTMYVEEAIAENTVSEGQIMTFDDDPKEQEKIAA
jgi:hypothetical protein